jgi:hypothetical protein
MKPTILLATTCRWLSTARLSMALAKSGCTVRTVCPRDHPLGKTGVVDQQYDYRGLTPLSSFAEAIDSTKPDFIIPSDDLAVQHLHRLYHRARTRGEAGAATCQLIERSLGSPESFPIVYARTRFIELAKQEGVRVPNTGVIANRTDLRHWTASVGFPMVLKANGTSGGEGVRVVDTPEEAERAFQTLQAPPLLARAAKWALVDRDFTLVWPTVARRRSVVNAQAFVPGREATTLVACWKGTVLAGLHFEVLSKQNPAGPATVMRLVENAEMSSAAEKMVRRLHLSGLHGFDFMLEAGTGDAYLIEINPRATQVGHLTFGPGRDLPAALHAAISGEAVTPAPKLTNNDTIALFPGEWAKNPASPFLRSGYHDVPWEAPDLLRACLRPRGMWNGFGARRKRAWVFGGTKVPRL